MALMTLAAKQVNTAEVHRNVSSVFSEATSVYRNCVGWRHSQTTEGKLRVKPVGLRDACS